MLVFETGMTIVNRGFSKDNFGKVFGLCRGQR